LIIFSTQAFTKLEPNCAEGFFIQPVNPILWPDPAAQEPQACQRHTLYLQMQHMTSGNCNCFTPNWDATKSCVLQVQQHAYNIINSVALFKPFVYVQPWSTVLLNTNQVVLSSSHIKGGKDAPMDKTTKASAETQEQRMPGEQETAKLT
jgi:hypothetical protein